jgi:thiol:disulfide interchange protein DsbD
MKHIKQFLLFLVCLLSVQAATAQQQGDELLPPEQAFKLQAWTDGDKVVAEYRIAPGYYMYRDAFRFDLESSGAQFGEPEVPDGKIKHDEFFGDVEIYRDQVAIKLPLNFPDNTRPQTLQIKTTGQGCADIGVCYPPLYQTLSMNLASSARVDPQPYSFKPIDTASDMVSSGIDQLQGLLEGASNAMAAAAPVAIEKPAAKKESGTDPLAMLQSLGADLGFADDEDEIPSPDQAFKLGAVLDRNNVIQSEIQLHKHTYLYQDKMKIKLIDGDGHELAPISLPAGDEKNDEFFGLMQVYHDFVSIPVGLISQPDASRYAVISYGYQGCVEDKICYPPMTKYLKVDTQARAIEILDEKPASANPGASTPSTSAAPAQAASGPTASTSASTGSEQDEFANLLKDASLWSIFLFFLAGVGLTFTPCVFPMIPILSGIIAGQGDKLTTRKAFTLSLVYVLAMAITYAIAGAIVGRFGAEFNIQAWFQDPVILSVFAAIFVALSLSMFGFYDLQMPSFIQSRITELSNRQEGGNLIGVAIMGLLSALIVGPCITAPLVGALLFISQTQDWVLGGLALFALGIGMGTPLLLIGTTAGNLLPRAGTWMDAVKAVFGVGLLAVAIWLLERILPTSITMLLMATLIIVSSIYMGAIDRLPEGASGWRKLWKGVGLLLLIYGVFYLYGVAAGSKDLIQPLKGLTGSAPMIVSAQSGATASQGHVNFERIKGEAGLKQALAKNTGKPAMLDFYADWCVSCKEMEKYAFTHPDVLTALEGVTALQSDVTPFDADDKQLLKSFGIFGPPAILFFDRQGNEIPGTRVVGEMSGPDFAAHVVSALKNI